MKRTLLRLALGLAALLGGSLAVILWATRPPPPAAPPVEARAAEAPVVATPPAPAPPRPRAAPRPGPARAGWKTPSEGPDPVPMADRVVRKAVRKALQAPAVQARLARCVDPVLGSGGGPARGRVPRAEPAVLLLELELRPGDGAQIVEVEVRSFGGASARSVSCAQAALRGRLIPGAVAETAGRVRMPFPLNPRSGALAAAR